MRFWTGVAVGALVSPWLRVRLRWLCPTSEVFVSVEG